MAPAKKPYIGCPVQHALSFIGGKWQMGILWNLRQGPLRFGALRRKLPGLSEKVLTGDLKFFESHGIVSREVFAAVPPRVEYRLTPDGRRLVPVLEKIVKWGYAHLQEQAVTRTMRSTPRTVIEEIESA